MRRIRALLLLATILSSPIVAFAEAIPQSTGCCCSGTMCPMHKSGSSRQGPQGKPICGVTKGIAEECQMSTCDPHSDSRVLRSAPEAVFPLLGVWLLPEKVRISVVSEYRKEPSRFVL